MAISPVVKNFRDGTIKLEDALVGALTVQFESGDLKASGFMQGQAGITMYLDRGEFGQLRKQNYTPVTGSFTAHCTEISDATNKNLMDIVGKTGAYALGTSTSGANADVWTLDLTITIEGTNFGDASDHVIKLEDCHCTIDFAEGDPDTFSISFTCCGPITLT